MRGPGLRLDLDVRRRWRCPLCGVERRTQGDVTQIRCACTADAAQMKLVPAARPPRPQPKPHDPYMDVDSFGDDPEGPVEETAAGPASPPVAEQADESHPVPADGTSPPRSDRRPDRKSRRPDRRPREQTSPAPAAEAPPSASPSDESAAAELSGAGPVAIPLPAPDVSPPPDPGT